MGNTSVGAVESEEDEETTSTEVEDTGTDDAVTDQDADEDDAEADEAAILAALPAEALALFEQQRERLAKANASSSNRRKIIQQMRKAGTLAPTVGPKPTAPKTEGKTATFDPEAFKASLLAELQGVQQTSAVLSKAERALKSAGLVLPDGEAGERKLARVMRMVDWSNVTPDEVADEIDDLKADNPELFKAVRKRPKTGGVSGPNTIRAGSKSKPEDELFD